MLIPFGFSPVPKGGGCHRATPIERTDFAPGEVQQVAAAVDDGDGSMGWRARPHGPPRHQPMALACARVSVFTRFGMDRSGWIELVCASCAGRSSSSEKGYDAPRNASRHQRRRLNPLGTVANW